VKRVVVTGGSGFIGGHLVRALVDAGDDVYAVSRRRRNGDGASWLVADLSDGASTGSVFEQVKPEVVFHLAGFVSGSRDLSAVAPSLRDNVVASVNVLVESARCGARVVLAGSMEEPEAGAGDASPASPYAAAKASVAAHAAMLHRLHALSVVTMRLFMVYGPGQHDRSKLVPYVVSSLLDRVPPQLSSGTRPVDWIYVDDVVRALVDVASRDDVAGDTLDIGSGVLTTVRALVERIASMIETGVRPAFGALPDRPNEVIRVADCESTRRAIDWKPAVALDEGLRRTIEWYRTDDRVREEVLHT
jgi:UDP-glucose 4-epimerase